MPQTDPTFADVVDTIVVFTQNKLDQAVDAVERFFEQLEEDSEMCGDYGCEVCDHDAGDLADDVYNLGYVSARSDFSDAVTALPTLIVVTEIDGENVPVETVSRDEVLAILRREPAE